MEVGQAEVGALVAGGKALVVGWVARAAGEGGGEGRGVGLGGPGRMPWAASLGRPV